MDKWITRGYYGGVKHKYVSKRLMFDFLDWLWMSWVEPYGPKVQCFLSFTLEFLGNNECVKIEVKINHVHQCSLSHNVGWGIEHDWLNFRRANYEIIFCPYVWCKIHVETFVGTKWSTVIKVWWYLLQDRRDVTIVPSSSET